MKYTVATKDPQFAENYILTCVNLCEDENILLSVASVNLDSYDGELATFKINLIFNYYAPIIKDYLDKSFEEYRREYPDRG